MRDEFQGMDVPTAERVFSRATAETETIRGASYPLGCVASP